MKRMFSLEASREFSINGASFNAITTTFRTLHNHLIILFVLIYLVTWNLAESGQSAVMIKAYHQVLAGFKRGEHNKHSSFPRDVIGEEERFHDADISDLCVPNFRNKQIQTDLTFMERINSDSLCLKGHSDEQNFEITSYRTIRELNRDVHREMLFAKQNHGQFVSELSGIGKWKISNRKRKKNFVNTNRKKIKERASRYSSPSKIPWR